MLTREAGSDGCDRFGRPDISKLLEDTLEGRAWKSRCLREGSSRRAIASATAPRKMENTIGAVTSAVVV